MNKKQRILICGDNIALAGIEASLGLDAGCEVVSRSMPVNLADLHELHPDVVIFDSQNTPPAFIYELSKELALHSGQALLLIGIDLETNRAIFWSGQEAIDVTTRDLSRAIHHTGKTGPLGLLKKALKLEQAA